MSDLRTALEKRVSAHDWQVMANHAGTSPEELKDKVLTALTKVVEQRQNQGEDAAINPIPVLSEAKVNGDCTTQDFSFSLYDIIGIKGSLTLCGSSTSDWSATLKFCLTVAGSSVWCTSYQFDQHNFHVCFSPSVLLAKAKICFNIDIHTNKVCLRLNGNACVWGFGWHCGSFDTTLFCIPF